jgi:uncharacterized protein (TIGR01777 family)
VSSKVAVSGASGVVGTRLCESLAASGHEVVRLVRGREAKRAELRWDPAKGELDAASLEGIDTFVHLSGENIAAGRWSESRKRELIESRTLTTRLVAETLPRLRSRPQLICASAVGFYGDRGSEWLDETSPAGRGFTPEICVLWEKACEPAREARLRVVNLRLGIVLDPSGGALPTMSLPFKLGLGGKLGRGSQYISWVGLDELVAIFAHVLVTPALIGPVNATAPNPVTNAELTQALAAALHRPALFTVPAFALRLALGEAADEMLLGGARVKPAKLLASGYRFRDPELAPLLKRLFTQ